MFDKLTANERRQLCDRLISSSKRLNGSAATLLHLGRTIDACAAMGALTESTELVLDLTAVSARATLAEKACQ